MQRLHEDDLVGHVLGQEPWEVLRRERKGVEWAKDGGNSPMSSSKRR